MATFDLADLHEAATRNKQAAGACAQLRWAVVPWKLRDNRKVPSIRGWTKGGALRGQEISEWWVNNPDDIPGVVTGEESGMWVLDIDPRHGGNDSIARLDAIGALGRTFRVDTPSGGWHLYFAYPAGAQIGNQQPLSGYPGIDVRGIGGFVAAPGAVVPGYGQYRPPIGPTSILAAPDWLIEIARGGTNTWAIDGQDWSETDGHETADPTWLQWQLTELGMVPPGGQHEALRRFTFQMRRKGMRQVDAEAWAVAAAVRFMPEPGKSPWTEEDGRNMVVNTWARISPGVVEAELAAWAAAQAPGVPAIDVPAPAALPSPPPGTAVVLGEPPQTIGPDDENAQDLMAFASEQLMWMAGANIWFWWDGRVWTVDDDLHRHRIVQELGVDLTRRGAEAGPDGFQEFARRATRLGTAVGRNACLDYARHLFAVNVNDLDANMDVINTPAGLVNIETGEIRPARPSDMVTKITRAEYDPTASDVIWERILADTIPSEHDRIFFQKWAGYCLTGRTQEKVILALHGPAGSGKSTISEPFSKAMGQYAALWQPDVIVDRSGINVDEAMYRVRGARLVTVSEMRRGTRLNEGIIKYATGADSVAARGLYMSTIEYRPQFKLWVHTNFVPDSSDDALVARFAFLKMGLALERDRQDPRVKTYLEEDAGAQRAIMAWAVRGWRMVLEGRKGVGRPEHSDEEAKQHLLRSDPVRRFIFDVLERSENTVIDPDAMVAAYEAWCRAERIEKPLGPNKFAAAMDERGIPKERFMAAGARVTGYRGWAIKANAPATYTGYAG